MIKCLSLRFTGLPLLLGLFLLTTLRPLQASADQEPERITRIVVVDLQAIDVEDSLVRQLSSMLALTIRGALPEAEVLDQDDIRRLLEFEAEKLMLASEQESKAISDLGEALDARHLATGTVGRIGDQFTIELKLFDTTRARSLRHVGERGIAGPQVLMNVVSVLGAHLVDPSSPADAAIVDIGGSGRVSVDGEIVGQAPIRQLRVPSGTREFVWLDERHVTLTIGLLPYHVQRINPSMASPIGPDGFPVDREGDLGRIFLRGGLGGAGSDGLAGAGWSVRAGYTLGSRLDVFFLQNFVTLGVGSTTDAWYSAVGVGWLFGKRFRLRPNIHFGVGTSNTRGFSGAGGIGLDASFVVNRYFEMGLDFTQASLPGTADQGYGQVQLYVGIPSAPRLPMERSPFMTDTRFWVTGSVVGLIGLLTFLSIAVVY